MGAPSGPARDPLPGLTLMPLVGCSIVPLWGRVMLADERKSPKT